MIELTTMLKDFEIKTLVGEEIPEMLREISDAPDKIYLQGKLPSQDTKILCVVGSRKYTQYGKDACEKLISGLRGYNICIVSGLALGMDGIAHKAALDAGYDAAIIDAVKLPLDENIILTKKCVDYARELSKKENRDILIEAEIGFIGTSSKLLDAIPDGISENTMTTPEDAKHFVDATGVDLLAPSVGNIHGMVKGGNPRLHPERVKAIRQMTGVPLVLHGGSGSMNEDFTACIKEGIDIVHINTEIRVAYKDAVKKFLIENPDEVAPYKILRPAVNAIEGVVEARLKLFNNIN